jgi:hypothetical protein
VRHESRPRKTTSKFKRYSVSGIRGGRPKPSQQNARDVVGWTRCCALCCAVKFRSPTPEAEGGTPAATSTSNRIRWLHPAKLGGAAHASVVWSPALGRAFLYDEELQHLVGNRRLTAFNTAFSSPERKTYAIPSGLITPTVPRSITPIRDVRAVREGATVLILGTGRSGAQSAATIMSNEAPPQTDELYG